LPWTLLTNWKQQLELEEWPEKDRGLLASQLILPISIQSFSIRKAAGRGAAVSEDSEWDLLGRGLCPSVRSTFHNTPAQFFYEYYKSVLYVVLFLLLRQPPMLLVTLKIQRNNFKILPSKILKESSTNV